MRRMLATAAGALMAITAASLTAPSTAQAAEAPAGFHVSDGRLLDANDNDFVLRGVSHAHTWYTARTPQALKDIKALGANSARVVLSTGDQWTKNDTADVTAVVEQCKASRLVCVLEAHDTTGYGEAGAAAPLSRAVDYWKGIKSAVEGQEEYIILNLGNEPYGNTGYENWTSGTADAIESMRIAGFKHTLMVDAPNWGQDWSGTMRDDAAGVFAADPDKNTVFSIHMYGVYDTATEVQDYLNRFVSQKLPIVVGEFGDAHSDGNPDEDAIMATTQQLGIGYMGWSWSGNGGGVEYLDMATDFDASRLTPWGNRFFNGPNGVKETAREASVYKSGACKVSYKLSDWGSGFNADVTVHNTGTTAIKGWQLRFPAPGTLKVDAVWNAELSQEGSAVQVTNAAWTESIQAGGSVNFGFTGSSSASGIPSTFSLNGVACTTG